jgi:hypothetical protein
MSGFSVHIRLISLDLTEFTAENASYGLGSAFIASLRLVLYLHACSYSLILAYVLVHYHSVTNRTTVHLRGRSFIGYDTRLAHARGIKHNRGVVPLTVKDTLLHELFSSRSLG